MKKNLKVAVLFYMVMVLFTFIISANVTRLESKEDYYKYKSNMAMNNLK